MDPELRTLTPDDWMIFRDTRLRALADSPDAFGVTLDEARDQPESLWRSRVGSPGPTLVAFEEDRPVAMGGVFAPPDEEHAYIWGMWTAPESRGRGHAVRILDALVEWCDEHDLDVLLHVTEGNDAARRIYVTRGFRPTGESRLLRDGSDLHCEELRLARVRDTGPFFHGTKADLEPGQLLAAGHSSNFGERRAASFVYLTATLDAATWGAELAVGDGPGRIYRVEPTGRLENDPNLTDKRFPGNPTRSYRTREPLRVVGEVSDWEPHPADVLQHMRDSLEELRRQGIEAIDE